jgi:BolA family transcriptional regulator, general stress-responsive regulator
MGRKGFRNKANRAISPVRAGGAAAISAIKIRRRVMQVKPAMIEKLNAQLAPVRLDIVDESARHAGHAGARPEGETHFRVEIVSEAFRGLNRVARQRRVYEVLAEELKTRVHALSLSALTPEEDRKV